MGAPATDTALDARRVCLGVVTGAHGVRGLVRVRPYTDTPEAVAAYGPVTTEGARILELTVIGRGAKGQVLARIAGIGDRTAAEALKGERLMVDRARLPRPQHADEFYHVDLIGLAARTPDGRTLGNVRAVYDLGAGDIIEIDTGRRAPLVLPFTREVVPQVDVDAGTLVVDPPAGLVEDEAR